MANSRLRGLTWWRKWAKKEWAITAVGFSLIVFLFTLISDSWSRRDDSNLNNPFDHTHDLVDLTLVRNAKNKGACTWPHLYFVPHFFTLLFITTILIKISSFFVFFLCLNNKIAVCLDGSLPGYHFQKGFGSGSNNWLLHVEVFFFFHFISCL